MGRRVQTDSHRSVRLAFLDEGGDKFLLPLGLKEPGKHVGHVLAPERPDVSHVGHFLFGELHVLRSQPVLELTVHADEPIGRAADDP